MLLSSHLEILLGLLSSGLQLGKYVEARDPFTVSEAYELKEQIVEGVHPIKGSFFKVINTGTIDPYMNFWGTAELRYLKKKFSVAQLFESQTLNKNTQKGIPKLALRKL